VEDPVPSPVPVQVNVQVDNRKEAPPPPAADSSGGPSREDDSDKQEEVKRVFEQGRKAFQKGDYARAQEITEEALQALPGDATLHEFRALTLFARKKYRDAAATIYSVLGAGPGWNWETLISLYPGVKTYTQQLRALEKYQRENPRSAEAHFLLAYHYLTIGSKDAAIKQLEKTVKVNAKDQLSAQLLRMLKKPPEDADDRPRPQE
jgi:tetratricopeptide (TPR) repeat protein